MAGSLGREGVVKTAVSDIPRDLSVGLSKYAALVSALLSTYRSTLAASAAAYFSSVAPGDSPTADWGWAAVLLDWPHWRPHRIERRLSIPDDKELERVSADCRAAAEAIDARSRRWLPLAKPSDDHKGVLLKAAELLDAVRLSEPNHPNVMSVLGPAAKEVDQCLNRLPDTWAPVRLADLVRRFVKAAAEADHGLPTAHGPWDPAFTAMRGSALAANAADNPWWAAWLGGAGSDWFHDLASLAQTSRDASAWLDTISQTVGVRCYPSVNSETGGLSWPSNVPVLQPGLTIRWEVPPGVVVHVDRFATTAAAARFHLLVGSERCSPLGTAILAWRAASDADLAGVRAALGSGVEDALQTDGPPGAHLVLAVLDELAREEPRPAVDVTITAIRRWAKSGGWSVIPEGAPSLDQELTVRPVFKRETATGGVVRLKSYGLRSENGVIRNGEVVVSAGPPPHGLTELEAQAAAAPGATGEALRAALRGLRQAGLEGYLEFAVVDLYRLFWDQVYPAWTAENPSESQVFADNLLSMVREAFDLHPFYPHNYRDQPPESVLVPPGTRMTTGRVVRVLRPGLTANGALRLPARVEAE
jgi:hypothetical protein